MFGSASNPSALGGDAEAIAFFVLQWIIILVGAAIHIAVDRRKHGHREGRGVELLLLWVLVFGGASAIYGGHGHISPLSDQLAEAVGETQSMFQREVGWGDIALGILGGGCAWRALRGHWMTAAVVVLAVQYGATRSATSWSGSRTTTPHPTTCGAIPSDILQPLLAVLLFIAYRRADRRLPETDRAAVGVAARA